MRRLLTLRGGPAQQELVGLLEARGWAVEQARSILELERLCRETPPRVVVLDYESGDYEAIDLSRRWKMTRPLYFPSLIFAGADLDQGEIITGLRTGANLVLSGPFQAEAVEAAIAEELHRFDQTSLPLEDSYVITDKIEYLWATNRFLDLVFHCTPALPEMMEDLRLCMGELGMNAIVHGNRGDKGKKVHVHYTIEHKRVAASIADEGPGFKPQDLPDPTSPERLLLPSGRGIFLVRQFTDELSFNERGNEVRFVKKLG